jgi:protoporphyrinogen IX oxidase
MMDLMQSFYPWILAGHVISVIAWMAGLFYLPRLFVHNAERGGEGHADLLTMMQGKLLRVIMRPAFVATWVFGLTLVLTPGVIDWSAGWPWTKAAAVLAMSGFHGWCQARQREFEAGTNTRTGRSYRIMNEVPTVLLLVIVISVIVRPF